MTRELAGFPLHLTEKEGHPGCLTCVGVDVVPEEGDSAESLQAQVAQVRPLITVDFYVTSETREFGRSEWAGITLEDSGGSCRERTHNDAFGKIFLEQFQQRTMGLL